MIVEMQSCQLKGTTPCSGKMCMVNSKDGITTFVCQGHYEELWKIAWR